MKKTLIALAALVAAGAASAQVTLYGILDLPFGQSVTTTTAAGVDTKVNAKGFINNGINGNRWGMTGSEDLGGGMKANFKLEAGLSANDGTFNAGGFNRTASVGLAGGFGEVKLGRNYTPLFAVLSGTDVDGTSTWSSTQLFGGSGVRSSNSLTYNTPAMGGFGASLQLASQDGQTTVGAAAPVGGKTRQVGYSFSYAAGPLMVGLGGDTLTTTAGVVDTESTGMGLGVTYDLGMAKLYANWARAKVTPVTTVTTYTEGTETNLGVSVPMGAMTITAGYGRNTTTSTAAGAAVPALEGSGNDWLVGLNYRLSKRTDVYVRLAQNSTMSLPAVAAGANGTKVNHTHVAVRHTF